MIAWLLEQIASILLGLVGSIIILILDLFVGGVAFAPKPNTMGGPLNPYIKFLFGDAFSSALPPVIIGVCLVIVLLNAMIQLYRNILEDDKNAPSPFRVLWNSGKTAIFVGCWYKIGNLVLNVAASIWKGFIGQTLGKGLEKAVGSAWANKAGTIISGANFGKGIKSTLEAALIPGLDSFKSISVVVGTIIALIIFIHVLINLFKGSINLVQRFVVLSILYFFAPFPLAMGNNVKYEQMPKSYFSLIISNCFNVIVSSFLILITAFCMVNISGLNGSMFLGALCLDAVSLLINEVDSYLGQIGLRSGGTGRTMGDSFMRGAKTTAIGAGSALKYKAAGGGLGTALAMGALDATGLGAIKQGVMATNTKMGDMWAKVNYAAHAKTSEYARNSKGAKLNAQDSFNEAAHDPNLDAESQQNMDTLNDMMSDPNYNASDWSYDADGGASVTMTDSQGNRTRFNVEKDENGNRRVTKEQREQAAKEYRINKARQTMPSAEKMEQINNLPPSEKLKAMEEAGIKNGGRVLATNGDGYSVYDVDSNGNITKMQDLSKDQVDLSGNYIQAECKVDGANGTATMTFDSESFTATSYAADNFDIPKGAKDVTYHGNSVTYKTLENDGKTTHLVNNTQTYTASDNTLINNVDPKNIKKIDGSNNVVVHEKGNSKLLNNKQPISTKYTTENKVGKNAFGKNL